MKKKIIKNTISLYIRMVVIMAVTLYTSRIVLKSLGFYDFGLYNVIGSIIIILTFIQGISSLATQRFISFSLGKNDFDEAKRYFNASVQAHMVISCFILTIAEVIGRWLVYDKFNFPSDKVSDMMIVYHISMITVFFQLMQTPFMSALIACDKMEVFAKIGIVDALLRLTLTVLFSVLITEKKLIMYPIFICIGYVIVFFLYWWYSKSRIAIHHIDLNFIKNLSYIKSVFIFSFWSLFGSLSLVSVSQGFSLLTYYFFGPIANGAVALAEQVLMALSRVTGTIQTVFNPQIVQSYSAKKTQEVRSLIDVSHTALFFVIAITAIPLFSEAHYVLSLWLTEYPPLLPDLVKIIALYIIIDSLSGPFVSVAYAIGELKKYQIIISLIMLGSLALAILMYMHGFSVIETACFRIFCALAVLGYRAHYVSNKLDKKIFIFFLRRFTKYMIISIIAIFVADLLTKYFHEGFIRLCMIVIINFMMVSVMTFYIVLNNDERRNLFYLMREKYGSKL